MIDLKLTAGGDLDIDTAGEISTTESVAQAVSIRLKWFLDEWRLGHGLGFPYFEEVFVKNPNLTKIRFLLRDLVMEVDGVTEVTSIEIQTDPRTRRAQVCAVFTVGKEIYKKPANKKSRGK